MKKIKKNNKGFSLVELIVVILIMAIIAVALAPQVIKWVNRSKQSSDMQNYNSLVANCQLALTNSSAYAEATATGVTSSAAITVTIATNGTDCVAPTGKSCEEIKKALTALDANWQGIERKDQRTGIGDYTIEIFEGNVVAVQKPDVEGIED